MSNKTRLQQNNSELNEIYSIASGLIKQQDVLTTLTSDADATAENILAPYTAYVKGEKIVGTGVKGGCRIETGEIMPTSNTYSLSINNPFANTEKIQSVFIGTKTTGSYEYNIHSIIKDVKNGRTFASHGAYSVYGGNCITITDDTITFNDPTKNYTFPSGMTYQWEVIGDE